MSNNSSTVLQYLVRQPQQSTEKTPVIILLHGVGSSEQSMFALAGQLPGDYLVISARAPHTLNPGSYAWFQVDFSTGKPVINPEQAEASRKLIIQFIKELKRQHQFDERQVYLGGFSQGGIMSYSVGLTNPELVKGIFILSSRLLEEVKPQIAPVDQLKKLRIFVSHGTVDEVLNIAYAHAALSYLTTTLPLHPVYKEYEGLGHTISQATLTDLVKWLNEKE